MEMLHAATPRLNFLQLMETYIFGSPTTISMDGKTLLDTDGSKFVKNTASALKTLEIGGDCNTDHSSAIYNNREELVKLLVYIGCKYSNINLINLEILDYCSAAPPVACFQQPILNMTRNTSTTKFITLLGLKQSTVVEILQNCPSLENLYLDGVADYDDRSVETDIKESNIKALDYMVSGIAVQANRFLDFVLRSCPLLEEIRLCGDYVEEEPGVLSVNLLNHTHLKSIRANIYGTSYYTFSHIESKRGKKWADFDHQIGRVTENNSCNLNVDFAWQGDVTLRLNKAPI